MEEKEGRLPLVHRQRTRLTALFALALLASAAACKGPSEEDKIKKVVRAAIEAANDKKPGRVVDDALPEFKGPSGADLSECRRILTGYLISPGWVHVFERKLEVRIVDPTRATVLLDVILARGNPVAKLEDFVPTNGDALIFDVVMKKLDGQWKFESASYRRATP